MQPYLLKLPTRTLKHEQQQSGSLGQKPQPKPQKPIMHDQTSLHSIQKKIDWRKR